MRKIYFKDLKTGTGSYAIQNYFGIVKSNDEIYRLTTRDMIREYCTLNEILQLVQYEIDRLYTITDSWTTGIYMEWLKEIELDLTKILQEENIA